MDLTLSDEQAMLRESVERFVRDSAASQDQRTLWRTFAELGWLALPLSADHGGLGGTLFEASLLVEEFGRGALSTPYVSTVILGGGLVQALGTQEQCGAILPQVANGDCLLALAHCESGPRGGNAPLRTKASPHEKGWRLDGSKVAVVDGSNADILIVSASTQNDTALFIVERSCAGLSFNGYPMPGGGSAATIGFKNVHLPASARLGSGDVSDAIEAASDAAVAAFCAENVGIMAALLDATVTYTNTREQFGKALTANQNVRLRLADMAVALDEARSLALRAVLTPEAPVVDRIRAVAGAKVGVGRGAKRVAELAIQLHGAMGVTEELTIGTYYKRVLALDAMFGGSDHALVRHARASGRLTARQEAA